MKKIIVGLLVIATVFGVSVYSNLSKFPDLFIAQPGQEYPINLTYTMNAEIGNIPQKEKVYKMINPVINEGNAKEIAKRLELVGPVELQENTQEYVVKEGKKIFKLEKGTGFFSYMNMDKLHNLDIIKSVPTDEECELIARKFLNERNLLPARFDIVKIVPTTTQLEGEIRTVAKDVWFYPTVDGKAVYGVSRIIVTIGHLGEIEGVNKYYRDIEYHSDAALKSVQEAFEEVKQGKASNNISPKATKASVDEITVGYWEDVDQPYLQPVYIFKGTTQINGQVEKFDAVVPAIKGVSIAPIPCPVPQSAPKI